VIRLKIDSVQDLVEIERGLTLLKNYMSILEPLVSDSLPEEQEEAKLKADHYLRSLKISDLDYMGKVLEWCPFPIGTKEDSLLACFLDR